MADEIITTEEVAPETTPEVVETPESVEPEKPATDWEARAHEAEKRADDITERFNTLMDSVAKLIDAGVVFGAQEPQRHNAAPREKSPSEKALDKLFTEGD